MKLCAIPYAALYLLAASALGCGDDGSSNGTPDATPTPDAPQADAEPVDAMPEPDADPNMPELLSQTGLYADIANGVLADRVAEFQPGYELWSDGAVKRRWVLLPDGAQIDTSDMDFWTYPQGTKLWKEFVSNGVRVETRILYKFGSGVGFQDWYMMAYLWNDEQTEAVAAPDGVIDAKGTEHDVPDTRACRKCHARMRDVAIGFSALLLDHTLSGFRLDDLVQQGSLTVDPPGGGPTYFTIPGDLLVTQPALGYIHANCGNCHNMHSDVLDAVSLRMRLAVGQLATVEETDAYIFGVGVPPEVGLGPMFPSIIEPGDPEASAVHFRMNLRGDEKQMPTVGSEVIDADGLLLVDNWIRSLQ